MNKHILKIKQFYNNKDDHQSIERADLIVLCYELLFLENNDITPKTAIFYFRSNGRKHPDSCIFNMQLVCLKYLFYFFFLFIN
jgi:hypothetical protein